MTLDLRLVRQKIVKRFVPWPVRVATRRLVKRARKWLAHRSRRVSARTQPIPQSIAAVADALAEAEGVLSTDDPIVVGPWMSEVGFEILYWIPMLRRLLKASNVDSSRVIAVSRGGPRSWYGGIAEKYVDIFDHVDPKEFRELRSAVTSATGSQKQMETSELDDLILRRLAPSLPDTYSVLHPSVMYRAMWPVWTRRLPLSHWMQHTHYRRIVVGDVGARFQDVLAGLPEHYVAVKAYWSDCLPENGPNRRTFGALVRRLAARNPVVLLSTGLGLDDHSDTPIPNVPNVIDLSAHMDPSTNLELQTAVIRRARAFFGTYGGFSYLAPFLGVPSLSLYSEPNFNATHLDTMRRSLDRLSRSIPARADFTVANIGTLSMLHLDDP